MELKRNRENAPDDRHSRSTKSTTMGKVAKEFFTNEMKRIFSIQISMLLQKRIEPNEQIKWSDIFHYYLVWCANIQRDSDILFSFWINRCFVLCCCCRFCAPNNRYNSYTFCVSRSFYLPHRVHNFFIRNFRFFAIVKSEIPDETNLLMHKTFKGCINTTICSRSTGALWY